MKNTPTSSEIIVPLYKLDLIKTCLYAYYSGRLQDPDIEIICMYTSDNPPEAHPKQITVTNGLGGGFFRVEDWFIYVTIRYKGLLYQLSTYSVIEPDVRALLNKVYVVGFQPEAREASALMEKITVDALKNSPFKNAMLQLEQDSNLSVIGSADNILPHPIEIEKATLDEIFLPESLINYVRLFIQTVQNYDQYKQPLRYLFSGRPGTAKTKLIRAIANECKGKATFIFANGNERRIHPLFSFSKAFTPCVVCIDDIDLVTGSRKHDLYTSALAQLLQELDGFDQNNVFVLATTNDKGLVDVAASRPGRFDMILDVDVIEPSHYAGLLESKTQNINVIKLFSPSILETLKRKAVAGAFIANLVKHLELMEKFNSQQITEEYLSTLIDETYRGFYKEPKKTNGEFGYSN